MATGGQLALSLLSSRGWSSGLRRSRTRTQRVYNRTAHAIGSVWPRNPSRDGNVADLIYRRVTNRNQKVSNETGKCHERENAPTPKENCK